MPQRPDDCVAVLPLLEPYLDGELSPAEAARVREHLAHCPGCAAELRLAEAIQAGLRRLPALDAPPAVLMRVRAAALSETPETPERSERPVPAAVLPFERPAPELRRPASGRPRPALATVLAAALVLALLGTLLLFQLRSPQPSQPTAATAATAATPADIARATEQARYALACVGRASRRAGLELKDEVLPEHLMAPAVRSLSRSLGGALPPDSESAPRQGS
jgi:anti-sigma factor RsiW